MFGEFVSVELAIETLKAGKMVLLLDDEHRENEGDLVVAAERATQEMINFMTHHGRGLICLSMAPSLIERLHLPMMVQNNRSSYGTAFTVSIEAAAGVTTGISAQDRAHTIQVAIDPLTKPQDLVSPGHVFPLCAQPDGVLTRAGQTEGSVDLVRLAGFSPAAVICEVLNDDGTMSRRDQLRVFSKKHQIPLITVREIIDYRIKHELLVKAIASSRIPIQKSDFEMTVFHSPFDTGEHVVLTKPSIFGNEVPMVRLHCECITGDVFGSSRCDCGSQLSKALNVIAEKGGVLIYLRQEGRGIGLVNKLKAYALQEKRLDTVEANLKLGFPADNRDYAIAYQILKYLGIDTVRLMTNNPAKIEALEKYGIKVSERVPIVINPTEESHHYLKTKQHKFGHFLSLE